VSGATAPPAALASGSAAGLPRAAAWCALLAIVALAALGRFWNLGADSPLSLSSSNSEVTDGSWYLAEAVRRERRLPSDAYDALHLTLKRAHAWVAAWGVVLVVLGVGVAWTAWGSTAGLLAGLLLAVGFIFVGYGRAMVVYGPLAACLTAVVWLFLAARGRLAREIGVWLLLAALALWGKENAVVLAPALACASLLRARRPGRVLGLLALAAPFALALAWWVDPQLVRLSCGKLTGYVAGEGAFDVFKRWLRTPFASGVVDKAPLVSILGWLGVLAALPRWRRGEAQPPDQALTVGRVAEVLLAVWMVAWFAFHGIFQYFEGGQQPMRHMLGGLVPAALLTARTLTRLTSAEGFAARPHPAALFAWATLGAYWALGAGWTLAWPALVPGSGVAPGWLRALTAFPGLVGSAAALAALALAWSWRRGWTLRLRSRVWFAAVLVCLSLGLSVWRLAPMVATPTWSVRDANERVVDLVSDGASLYGPWAHALSWSHPGVTRHIPPHDMRSILERSTRMTHLVIDWGWTRDFIEQYRHNGIELELLERVSVRGHPIGIFRYPWAESLGYRLSSAEIALAEAAAARDRTQER
jgi:hypothetical protein